MEPLPIDARLIEQPPPVATQSIQPERPVAVHKPKPQPQVRQQASAAPRVSPPAEQNPVARKAETTNNTGVSVLTAAPGAGGVPGEAQVPTGASTAAGGSGQAGVSGGKGTSAGPHDERGLSRVGAAYLNNPRPVYPPAARKMGMEGTVMLKVLVGSEGNVHRVGGRQILGP